MKRIGFLLVGCWLVSFGTPLFASETGDPSPEWSSTGVPFASPLTARTGFFVGGGIHVAGFVNEIRRPAGGIDLRGGYGLTDRWLVYLQNDWTYTRQFGVDFNFFDFAPHLAYFFRDDLYLLGGAGLSLARNRQGTPVEGFNDGQRKTRLGMVGDLGVGYVFLTRSQFSLSGEVEGVYHRIKTGNFFEPLLRVLVAYQF